MSYFNPIIESANRYFTIDPSDQFHIKTLKTVGSVPAHTLLSVCSLIETVVSTSFWIASTPLYCFESTRPYFYSAYLYTNSSVEATIRAVKGIAGYQLDRCAVLIHGCHVEAIGWDTIVFGDKGNWGRVPTGIREALEKDAFIIFGTGASKKNGLWEAEYTKHLAGGEKLKDLAVMLNRDPIYLKTYLEKKSILDVQPENTNQEVESALKKCNELGINKLFLVSSPTHIARCLQAASKTIRETNNRNTRVYAIASHTSFNGSTESDVAIFEPPHRKEQEGMQPINKLVKQIFSLYANVDILNKFYGDLEALINKHKAKIPVKKVA